MADSTSLSVSSSSSNSPSLKGSISSALELLYWREPKKSAASFGLSLLVLVSLATLSIISVVSYLLLALLCVTITFRVYKSVVQAVQKSEEGHPYKSLLDRDVSVSPETSRWAADLVLVHLNHVLVHTRRLLLVEDLVDSLKLAAGMWLMTYIGAIFNGITIVILADIICFTSPLVYQKYKTQIDRHIELTRSRLKETLDRLQDKLPGSIKRTKAD
ncbi:unnamed protein product [Merluccius merluccius]